MLTIILIGILLHIFLMRGNGDGSHFGIFNRSGKGGGESTTIVQNTPYTSAQSADAVNAWVNAMPQVYETEAKYAPLQAQTQLDIAQQYALPLAQVYQQANEQLNPGITAMQKTLFDQTNAGLNATSMPDWMQKQYRSDFNANLGSNAGSPIGADYVSRNMQNQLYNQQQQYRQQAMTLAGYQPLTQSQPVATNNYTSSFTPSGFMNWFGNGGSTSNTKTSGGGGLFG